MYSNTIHVHSASTAPLPPAFSSKFQLCTWSHGDIIMALAYETRRNIPSESVIQYVVLPSCLCDEKIEKVVVLTVLLHLPAPACWRDRL